MLKLSICEVINYSFLQRDSSAVKPAMLLTTFISLAFASLSFELGVKYIFYSFIPTAISLKLYSDVKKYEKEENERKSAMDSFTQLTSNELAENATND